jgi:hypothetical protein
MRPRKNPFWKQKPFSTPTLKEHSAKDVPASDKPPLHVLVAVFTGTERSGWVCPHLTATLIRMSYDPRIRMSYVPIHAIHPVCQARNTAVNEYFLKSEADMLVIFDNDVAPPDNVVDAIVGMPDEAFIGVLPYWVWLPQERHTMPCFGRWEDGTMIIPDPASLVPGWQMMGAGGTGCMFIRREVFTSGKLTAPFFKIIMTAERGQIVSEDIYFTGHAADAGYPTWLNPDFHCSHFHTVDLADLNLGTVMVLEKFTGYMNEKYGVKGVTMQGLVQELHPELLPAMQANQSEMRDDAAAKRETATKLELAKEGMKL